MRIAVLGGSGFIGKNLISKLKGRIPDAVVKVLDREECDDDEISDKIDDFLIGDIRNKTDLVDILENTDVVINLAASTRVQESIGDPCSNFDVNVNGGFNVLECVRELQISRLVQASTGGAIVGNAAPPISETTYPNPVSPYGASKLALEGYICAYQESFGISAVSLRFSNVYGPRSSNKASIIANYIKRILRGQDLAVHGDGHQTRDYVFVEDICDGIINSALNREVMGVFQLGSGIPTSVLSLIEMLQEIVPPSEFPKIEFRQGLPGEVRRTYCDISKAAEHLSFRPRISLCDGLRSTWDWYRKSYVL